jgi:hypothetical protein
VGLSVLRFTQVYVQFELFISLNDIGITMMHDSNVGDTAILQLAKPISIHKLRCSNEDGHRFIFTA